MKRSVDIAVISDVHLGTFGCRATELLHYLKQIEPNTLILNGDIIDIWQFSKNYFPKSHMKVVRYILKMAMNGTKVVYITGNHDELLRKFVGMNFGNIELCNQYEVEVNSQKTLFFHGDVFDLSIQHAKWLAKLGGKGYDVLILLNTFINFISEKLGGKRVSLSKKIKNSVKQAVSFINNFEVAAAEYASKVNANVVVCGHIHHPADKIIEIGTSSVRYLNSGDWIENLSALEYHDGIWQTIHVNEVHELDQQHSELEEPVAIALLKEFQLAK